MSAMVTVEQMATVELGRSGGSPLTLDDMEGGRKYDAILYVQLFGWEGVRLYDTCYGVMAEYANRDWQGSPEYRAHVAAVNNWARLNVAR